MGAFWQEPGSMSNVSKGAQWSLVSGVFLMGMVACSPLEPIPDPEISDLHLTVDTLRGSLREAQRRIAELQIEIDQQRQSYADAQILRAQLEGSSREAERRLIEARHVIDLQREELAVARAERERIGTSGAALQGELRQLRKQLSKLGKQTRGAASSATIISRRAERPDLTNVVLEQEAQTDTVDESADKMSSVGVAPLVTRPSIVIGHVSVSIKPGDTLWSLARRYRTSVTRLMAINELINDRIHVGQILRVPKLSADALGYEAM
jgi:LysM repeat protein